jgi:hypothetical protein
MVLGEIRKTVLLLLLLICPALSMAQRIGHDIYTGDNHYLSTSPMELLTPKGAKCPFLIMLNYYDKYKDPYLVSLYSGSKLDEDDEILIKLSDGDTIYLYSKTLYATQSNLGILVKKTNVYQNDYQLSANQLEKLLNTPIKSISIYHSNYLNILKFKKNELGYYFKLCYKNIGKRLANPKKKKIHNTNTNDYGKSGI